MPRSEDPFLATMDQIRDTAQAVKNIQRRLEALPKYTRANDSIVTGELIKRLRTAVAELETAQAVKHVESFSERTDQAQRSGKTLVQVFAEEEHSTKREAK